MSTRIKIEVIDPFENLKDLLPLLKQNWKESGNPFDFVPEHAMKTYDTMSSKSILLCVGAYIRDHLVGYCVSTIYPHPLNNGVKVCNVDGLYVNPELRCGTAAARLMESTRNLAKVHEATMIHWHAPAGTGFAKALESRHTPISNYYREEL